MDRFISRLPIHYTGLPACFDASTVLAFCLLFLNRAYILEQFNVHQKNEQKVWISSCINILIVVVTKPDEDSVGRVSSGSRFEDAVHPVGEDSWAFHPKPGRAELNDSTQTCFLQP